MRIQLVAYHRLPAYVFARLKPRMFGECEMSEEAQVLDVRGLNCPLPVLKAKKAMRSLAAGDLLWVETTDPLSAIDIPAFCENDGHDLVMSEKADGYQRYLLRKQG